MNPDGDSERADRGEWPATGLVTLFIRYVLRHWTQREPPRIVMLGMCVAIIGLIAVLVVGLAFS